MRAAFQHSQVFLSVFTVRECRVAVVGVNALDVRLRRHVRQMALAQTRGTPRLRHPARAGGRLQRRFRVQDELVRMPKIDFVNDKAGKPVGINEHIGRRPILAFGNADADMQMIEYTMGGEGRRLGLFLHHTDAEREFACDRKSRVGTLDKALDQADAKGWVIVDMKKHWKTVFPAR